MAASRVLLRAVARQDIDAAVDFYLQQSAPQAATDLVDELERALQHLARFPSTGSPRYAHELDLPGLRVWALSQFPYLVFYQDQGESLDVWRVLHQRKDMPQSFQDQGLAS